MEEKNKYQEALDNAIINAKYSYGIYEKFRFEDRINEVKLLEELQKLLDKETPKEPINKGFKNDILQYKCPTCKIGKVGRIIDNCWKTKGEGFTNYCPNCGQKLKW